VNGVPVVGSASLGAPKVAEARFVTPGARPQAGSGGMYPPMYPPMGANSGGTRKNDFAEKEEVVKNLPKGLASAVINEKDVPVVPSEATRPAETRIASKKQESAST
jgi:hypothetical protein